MSTGSSNDSPDLAVAPKRAICQELEAIVKRAFSDGATSDRPIPSEVAQAVCTLIETIFIHGLRDAFFVKGSRHSKRPAPNLWPFISKYTHRSIKQQILGLNQIRTEVGKGRAWIRIVLAETTLEHYVNLFTKDAQINQFYDKSAFIRDAECIEVLSRSLKALAQVQIITPENSSLLNQWTPTPLILAGIIPGKIVYPSKQIKNDDVGDLDELDKTGESSPEMGVNALDLLAEDCREEDMPLISALACHNNNSSSRLNIIDMEDNESVLSHPSILEEPPNYGHTKFSTTMRRLLPTIVTENIVEDVRPGSAGHPVEEDMEWMKLGPTVEHTSEVVVHRRKTGRRRAVSRSSGGSGSNKCEYEIQIGKPNNLENQEKQQNPPNQFEEAEKLTNNQCSKMDESSSNDSMNGPTFSENENVDIGQQNKMVDNSAEEIRCEQELFSSEERGIDIAPKCSDKIEIPLGLSLQEELLMAEEGRDGEHGRPRKTSEPQISRNKEDIMGTKRAATFIVYSTDSSTTDLPTTFDEALREFLARENPKVTQSETSSSSVPIINNQRLLSHGSSIDDGEIATATSIGQSSAEEGDAIMSMEAQDQPPKPMDMPLLSPTHELPQKSLKIEPIKEEEDEDQPVEISRFGENFNENETHPKAFGHRAEEPYLIPKRLLFLTQIPHEHGLDKQNFRCKICRRNIGAGFGPFRICALTALYHCEFCVRNGDECLIPARAILNGDFRKWPVSKESRTLLRSIADRPLFRIDFLNPKIYDQNKKMRKIKDLRRKLGLLIMYLLSCKNSVAEDIKRRLWPHNHLHADLHLYSISDLECIADGTLERRLNSLISFALSHVQNCRLCIQKGFFCELCSSDRPIYPFQTEITYQCAQCLSCFHRKCASKCGLITGENTRQQKGLPNQEQQQPNCPKCLRRVKYSSAALHSLANNSPLLGGDRGTT